MTDEDPNALLLARVNALEHKFKGLAKAMESALMELSELHAQFRLFSARLVERRYGSHSG